MSSQGKNLPVWKVTNGWREIFTRIFDGVKTVHNISPEWLVNPVTHRRLKLDMLYPDIGVAVRLDGLKGKQRRSRLSLEEEEQKRIRDEARVQVSQEQGVQLIIVNIVTSKPKTIFQQIDTALSRVAQETFEKELLAQIKTARSTASTIMRQINSIDKFNLYADLWEDRQYRITEPEPTQPTTPKISYTEGMEVEHSTFGPGVVLSTTPSNGDMLVKVDFITAGEKTLAASLVGDKLLPR